MSASSSTIINTSTNAAGTASRIGDTNFWVATFELPGEGEETPIETKSRSPMALHFVLDNSGSMGRRTREAKEIFSALVDSAASRPCSLTLFANAATLLSDSITSSQQMLELRFAHPGRTNISSGVDRAMKLIRKIEAEEESSGFENKTHHVLILLTDGCHNVGPSPLSEFPRIGRENKKAVPNVQLSVVVVGITQDSDTSMGMHLKTSIETLPLDSDLISNIYFATSGSQMKEVTSNLVEGLNHVSKGTVVTVSHHGGKLLQEVGGELVETMKVRTSPNQSAISVLFQAKTAPDHVIIDGTEVPIFESAETDFDAVSDVIKKQINKIRVKHVASPGSARTATIQLGVLVDAIEKEFGKKEAAPMKLAKIRGAQRLSQHRNIVGTMHLARELRNQLADVANFDANSSEAQAAFLTGGQSKHASKALRRAAARVGDDVVLDPEKELARIRDGISKPSFARRLRSSLREDAMNHLSLLSGGQRQKLMDHVKAASQSDYSKLQHIMKLSCGQQPTATASTSSSSATSSTPKKVHTSALCWIPPDGEVFASIQTIRRTHDRHIKRWPPHLNLLYPFVPSDEFGAAAEKLGKILSNVEAFDVTLRDISHFSHGKSCTAWLCPDDTEQFKALQATCQAAFPYCDDVTSRGEFVPHLTVGQCANQTAVDALVNSTLWMPSTVNCGEICLISRKGKDDPFEVHWRIPLGTGTCIAESPSKTPAVAENGGNHEYDKNRSASLDIADEGLQEFVDSGTLAKYLNDVFFGSQQSYLSLLSPWEHIAEWIDLGTGDTEVSFRSLWELLLYVGSLAYPISVDRGATTQLNPFDVCIKKVNTTAIDTASLCCANQSESDVYGPEAGEPIRDALVLIDPSCPRSSAQIVSSALLGETFTSVVLSRDLFMYTGVSMKVALLAKCLFRCLQPEEEKKTKTDIVAEIQRQYRNRAYQCGSCGFGPVDHGGCWDLHAHHGEVDSSGATASNSCPSCGWFSDSLDEWEPWDGTVPKALIAERMDREEKPKTATKPLASKMDMALRIIYSFRKMFNRGNDMRSWYAQIAQRMVQWETSFTTKDEIDGVVQVLLAVAACDDDIMSTKGDVDAAFAPPVVLSLINEACARSARKRFRLATSGNESEAKEMAAKRVTEMLSITEASAPETTASLLEAEPSWAIVKESCCRDYRLDDCHGESEAAWAQTIAKQWCAAMGLVRALRSSIVRRGGGWDRLERDMETSLENYSDVVQDMQDAGLGTFCEMCDAKKATETRTLATMAAQAFLYNSGSSRSNLPDVRELATLHDIARNMRMRIYEDRVREKMSQWKSEAEALLFAKARAADIGQYSALISARSHVHSFDKETFWGLWEAAVCDGADGEKVKAFLSTACECFHNKYASGGIVFGKEGRKKRNR